MKEFRVKLDRGREQIEGLYRDIQAFLSTGPYRLITEFDQQRKENIIRFKGHRPPPIDLAAGRADHAR